MPPILTIASQVQYMHGGTVLLTTSIGECLHVTCVPQLEAV